MDVLSGFFWRGVKNYTFNIQEERGDDSRMRLLHSFLERSGITLSAKELSSEDAAKLVEKELLKMKTDLYSMKARRMPVPEAMNKLHEQTESLHNSFANGEKRLIELSVAIDASMVDRQAAEGIIKRIKEIEKS